MVWQERLAAMLARVRWGEKSFVALYLSLFSGVVVAWQYDPAAPFFSTSTIDLLIPFGSFWRSLHFYSSQLFFLCLLGHLATILLDPGLRLERRRWLLLVASLPVAVLLLFTGYVLRGDATGESAGLIAENIALSVPLVGDWLNNLLFSVTRHGMLRIYVNHLAGLLLLWLAFSWDHLRRFRVGLGREGWLVVALVAVAALVAAPMEPYRLGLFHIQGPWFFLGLQELLRYVQPFWAGVVFPATLLAGLGLVMEAESRQRALLFVAGWLLLYLLLSLVSALRG